jgi:putative component of membrane protein insertase Oxa1/YidC/SpoIIIJ protein YidD
MTATLPTIASPSALAAATITLYQRFLSPLKGFRCAHRVAYGKDSCSEFARRVALRRGPLAMLSLLRRRFVECGVAAQTLKYEARKPKDGPREAEKSSSCDASACDTSGCDLPVPSGDCGGGLDVGDIAGGADCCGDAAGCFDGIG